MSINTNKKVYNPFELKEVLDSKIVGQDKAKKQICMSIASHNANYLKEDKYYRKQNMFVIGSGGSGKSETIETLRSLVNVPIIVKDAYTLSKQKNMLDILTTDLINAAKLDLKAAASGIIVIENLDDALTSTENMQIDKAGVNFINKLSYLMSGQVEAEVDIEGAEQKETMNFKNVLFIVTCILPQIEYFVKYRKGSNRIGFINTGNMSTDVYEQVEVADLLLYGLSSNFLDNFSNIVAFTRRTTKQVIKIIEESDILKYYNEKFASKKVKLEIDKAAIEELGEYCSQKNLGIWSIKNIIEKKMIILEFDNIYENKVDKVRVETFLDI
ncbi:MAG: AAA family ATPase [Clostridia bacterium]